MLACFPSFSCGVRWVSDRFQGLCFCGGGLAQNNFTVRPGGGRAPPSGLAGGLTDRLASTDSQNEAYLGRPRVLAMVLRCFSKDFRPVSGSVFLEGCPAHRDCTARAGKTFSWKNGSRLTLVVSGPLYQSETAPWTYFSIGFGLPPAAPSGRPVRTRFWSCPRRQGGKNRSNNPRQPRLDCLINPQVFYGFVFWFVLGPGGLREAPGDPGKAHGQGPPGSLRSPRGPGQRT